MNKKWLIGCGGCLGVVVLAVIIILGAVWMNKDAITQGIEGITETPKVMFGDIPAKYKAVGMDLGKIKVAMLMDQASKRMVFAMEQPAKPAELNAVIEGDTEQIKAHLKQAMASNSQQQNTSTMKSLEILDSEHVELPETTIHLLHIRGESEKGYMPSSVALIPVGDDALRVLYVITEVYSADPDETFDSTFDEMDVELENLLLTTKIAESPTQEAVLEK